MGYGELESKIVPRLDDYFPFGIWASDDSGKRWQLDFNENGCRWTERNSAGQFLQRDVSLSRQGVYWRIERPNTAEVLAFLGASSAVIPAILAQGPQPSFMLLELSAQSGEHIVSHWNGLRWVLKSNGSLDHIEQPGSTPATMRDYNLPRVGNDAAYFLVTGGQITFDAEGMERGAFHSRYLHFPGGASGVTLGRGYDMKLRTAAAVTSALTGVGVLPTLASQFAGGAGLQGSEASTFVTTNRAAFGNLSPGQQKRLFEVIYREMVADVRRISDSPSVVQQYGSVDFNTLSDVILTTVVDLRFRGDYTPASRRLIQAHMVSNDLTEFGQALRDQQNWPNVPQDRFDRRVAYLAAHGG